MRRLAIVMVLSCITFPLMSIILRNHTPYDIRLTINKKQRVIAPKNKSVAITLAPGNYSLEATIQRYRPLHQPLVSRDPSGTKRSQPWHDLKKHRTTKTLTLNHGNETIVFTFDQTKHNGNLEIELQDDLMPHILPAPEESLD
jgi:hypothetical protein